MISPSNPNLTIACAQHLHAQGQTTQVELIYRRLIALDPRDATALHLLGMLCFHSGRRFEGLDWVRRSLLIRPDDASFHANQAILLGLSGRYVESIAAIEKSITLNPYHAPSHNNKKTTANHALA